MTGFQGTMWIRNSDRRQIVVVDDKQAASGSKSRPLRIKDLGTGKHHWTSPSRLVRKHEPIWGLNPEEGSQV